MKTNPFSDTFEFLIAGTWPIYVLWLLLLSGVAVAVYNLRRNPEQRTAQHLWQWIGRLIIGAMWWQQSLWKIPPYYTDNPGVEDSGLRHWVMEMINNAAFGLQRGFVQNVVLPHFNLFAPQVYTIEVVIAASLMLGLFTRLGAALGALMAINLWLGLYRASYEWPWTYFFMIVVMTNFVVFRAGRSLGIDAIITRKLQSNGKTGRLASRILAVVT
jgi:uncharacterized membrane protein YphA (DoxX/SURF4 family)